MTIRTLYVHVALNGVIFRHISYNIVPHARHLLPVTRFRKYYFKNYASSYRENITCTDE